MSPGAAAGATSANNSKAQEYNLDSLDTIKHDTDANGVVTINGADAGVTFFMDEEGRYYYQHSGENQDVDPLNCEEYLGNSEAKQQSQVLVEGEVYQTVTLAPSVGDAESRYVLVVQEGPEPVMNIKIKTDQDEDQVSYVHQFDEEEEEAAPEEGSDDKESIEILLKSTSVVKPTNSIDRKLFMCSFCPYTSHKRYYLMRHLKTHSSDRPHKCEVCERGFKTVASLQQHVNMHNGIKPFVCKYCNKPFTTSGELVRHVRYRHTHEKPHKCKECDYASVELSKMRRHMRCHTGERPYQCQHCTYASADTFRLKRHIRTHTGEKPYICDICNMSFTQSNSRNIHKLIHNVSDKPVFQCELCPAKLGRMSDLRIHKQNMHTTGTPLKCKRCGKSFPDRYSCKMHTKSHRGEKCFKCKVCPYASTALCHLKSHMLRHTSEKPFGCDQCDQAFRQKQLLRRHQNLHHNPNYVQKPAKKKTHICHKCDRAYTWKGNLIRHLATHGDSGHKDRASALNGSADSNTEPAEILKLDLEDKLEGSNLVMVESGDGQQYVVVEVIQVDYKPTPINADDEEIFAGDDNNNGDNNNNNGDHNKNNGDDNNNNEIHLHSIKGINQTVKLERDLQTCFGFDEKDMDEK